LAAHPAEVENVVATAPQPLINTKCVNYPKPLTRSVDDLKNVNEINEFSDKQAHGFVGLLFFFPKRACDFLNSFC